MINLSVTLEPGQKIGLVGYSGGGKSTFTNLIMRLYEISSGRILIDDQDIAHLERDSLLSHIGIIPQDRALFNRSLLDNIRYGKMSASLEEVVKAAIAAEAHEFISKLPDGL